MSTPTLSELQVLPEAVSELIDAFRRARPSARIRLWSRSGEAWSPLWPEGQEPHEAGSGPRPDSRRVRLETGRDEAGRFVLEVEGLDEESPELEMLALSLSRVLAAEDEARAAARELSERYEEINLLYSISEVLGSVISMRGAAHRILTEVADVLGARRASLWVLEPEDQVLRLAAAVGDAGLTGPIPVDDPHSVTARVFRERQALNVERGVALPRGSGLDPRPHGQEAFLSVPINFSPRGGQSRTIGVITLVGRRTNVRFSAGDERLLSAIASQVGAALETHRLMAESVRRERFERELELAHDLQLKLLPEASQFAGEAAVAARCAPADSVGGDFYHLFRLSDDRLGVVIGDVSSHGFAAALIMAMTVSAVAIYAQEAEAPADVLRHVHDALIDELENTEMHLSLFYGVLEPSAGRLIYANAGHPHAFRIDSSGHWSRLDALDPPIGTSPDTTFQERAVPWSSPDDLLFLFTDGLSDAFADEDGGRGEERLLATAARWRDWTPAEAMERIFELAQSARPTVPPDDRTAVLLRV